MSNFLNVSVLVLATMVLVLAGMLGYLYWQQNKLMRAMTSLSAFVQTQFTPPPVEETPETQPDTQETHDDDDDDSDDSDDSQDDRVSVELVEELIEQKVQVPEVPSKAKAETETEADNDSDVTSKTMPQLREILNKRGIPFGKRDSKSVLIELLKASS